MVVSSSGFTYKPERPTARSFVEQKVRHALQAEGLPPCPHHAASPCDAAPTYSVLHGL